MARVSKEKILISIPNYFNPIWRIIKRYKRLRGEFYCGADEYGLEKDITHRMIVSWLKEVGFKDIQLFQLGFLRRDLLFPLEFKTSIGIYAKR